MPIKELRGVKQKLVYRNERYNKGTVSSNDPLYEGSFRRLINFKVSNQGASAENREPFLTVPLYDLNNKEIRLSKDAFVFALNNKTENAFIFDPYQEKKEVNSFDAIILEEKVKDFIVIDGDTFIVEGERFRLAVIDCPELYDESFMFDEDDTVGEKAKDRLQELLDSADEEDGFTIFQLDFQTDKKDQFGRKIVYVYNNDILVNFQLLKEGLASFYDMLNYYNNEAYYNVKSSIKIGNIDFEFYDKLKEAYEESIEESFSPTNLNYTEVKINIIEDTEKTYFTKPKIYEITKETDLRKVQFEDEGVFEDKIIKRVINTFEINELKVKRDLELFTEENLRYELVTKDFSIINGKYQNQYLNMFVYVYDIQGNQIYRGLIELSYGSFEENQVFEENFFFKTYKKTEMKTEIQSLTSYRPNILDDRSIIPKNLIGKKANARGITSPSVHAVLLNVGLNSKLESASSDEVVKTKFFTTNGAVFNDIENYYLTPFLNVPNLLKTNKKNYMFRWDFVDLKEIDINNEEELKDANPIFRSAWTKFKEDPGEEDNISKNETRMKKMATNFKNLKDVDEYYLITFSEETMQDISTLENNRINLEDIEITIPGIGAKNLNILQGNFENFIENNSYETLKSKLSSEENDLTINEIDYSIIKVKNQNLIEKFLEYSGEENSFSHEENYSKGLELIEGEKRSEIFEKEKRIAFIFSPLQVKMTNEDGVDILGLFAYKTKGLVFDNRNLNNTVLPYEIHFKKLFDDHEDIDFKSMFKNGIQATFYLMTYVDEESLTENDEYYDILAYKKTTATYTYRSGTKNKYEIENFIDDRMDKESYMIKYCKYITSYLDRILVYGNPEYKNTVFMSEEGSPYYFSLNNIFEFDHEVIHVQTFKTISLVFTINDIWVIYPWETQDKETGIVTISYRVKKILYNISTETKNKNMIKNITRYITLMSNNVLYLIKPSTYIGDETEFYLNILSQNIDQIVKEPLIFINERLKYYNIFEEATDYEMNLNATDNYIKLFYSTNVSDKNYTLILTYDILNNRWTEEDTCSFGYPNQIYLLDSTTKYEMLTEENGQLFITYQSDKFKFLIMNEDGESYFDKNISGEFPIEYYLDTGYMKIREHLKKRFRKLQLNFKNINSGKIFFTYNFTADDIQFENNHDISYTTNSDNEIVEVESIKKQIISDTSPLGDFILDFSNFGPGEIMNLNIPLLGKGRLPRLIYGISSKNKFYVLSFGIIYTEHGGN